MRIDTDELSEWFAHRGRDLPWRRPECGPWGVLVSEIMLQQTPVARVTAPWTEWMRRWPRPSDLAAASPGDAVRLWDRLGYPRRALRLHAAATVIAAEHGDVVPDDLDALLALPGVGSYTARAVLAFAYRRRVPVVDTNVRRVVARAVHGMADAGAPSASRDMSDVDALLPADDATAARISAVLMEIGAEVCKARTPSCGVCPLATRCTWVARGRPAERGYVKPVQNYAGTDRQVRGELLKVLRGSDIPVQKVALDVAWPHGGQRDRCLDTLLDDGLVVQTSDGRFALPGEQG